MKYIKKFEKINKKYIIIGYSIMNRDAFYYLNDEDGYSMTSEKNFLERKEDITKEKIFNSKTDANIALKNIKKDTKNRNDMKWRIEDYEPYEVIINSKKYNL